MKRIELQLIITEDNGMWNIQTFIPNESGTYSSVSGKSRDEVLQNFSDSFKEDNLRYWYLMKEVQ